MKTRHSKSQAAFPRESSLSPFKPCLDEICIIFTPRASSLHARHANSPSVHPHAKHSTLEPAVQGLPSKTHGYPASLPGPRRVFWGTGCMGAHLSENTTCHRHHEHHFPTYCRVGKMQQRVLLGSVGCQQASSLVPSLGQQQTQTHTRPLQTHPLGSGSVALLKPVAVYFCVPFCSFPLTKMAWAEMTRDATKGWGKAFRRLRRCQRRAATQTPLLRQPQRCWPLLGKGGPLVNSFKGSR